MVLELVPGALHGLLAGAGWVVRYHRVFAGADSTGEA